METPGLIKNDPYLQPYASKIAERQDRIDLKISELSPDNGLLSNFANGHHYFGLHRTDQGWILREWAPHATGIWLTGTCNNWEIVEEYRFRSTEAGQWVLQLKPDQIMHLDEYKLWVTWEGGSDHRIPLYAGRVVQNELTKVFNAQVWDPPGGRQPVIPLKAKPSAGELPGPLLVYEAHVGMSSEEGKVNSYHSFRTDILPRIKRLGYNTLQLMAIQEHPYYGSFGYHVSSFFAPSSRFGTPDELRELISEAHLSGIRVIMDIVHSHAVKNVLEGPGLYDGSPGMLFHTDHRREHPAWDSLCFDYGKNETLHFLLSNCKFWLEEYGFDGYRFDGVTSMLYYDHGLGRSFNSYDAYFDAGVDEDALVFLTMANQVVHEFRPDAVTIAEDMSGLPGLAASRADGGLGFDYRLAMGIPDFWIRTLKEKTDEQWNVSEIFWELTNRRKDEKTVSYVESHDQALVGDKTILFRLADSEMYTHMSVNTPSLIIDRAIALHKLIRLVTFTSHGGGYLTFMGNEFGHPEWIDFPREGNNWSYHYARRQWSLADNPNLRYGELDRFEQAMIALFPDQQGSTGAIKPILKMESDHVLAFERDNHLFVFNFHPVNSYTGYGIAADPAEYRILLDTDSRDFGGFGRIDHRMTYDAVPLGKLGSGYQVILYLPSRVGLVLQKIPPRRVR